MEKKYMRSDDYTEDDYLKSATDELRVKTDIERLLSKEEDGCTFSIPTSLAFGAGNSKKFTVVPYAEGNSFEEGHPDLVVKPEWDTPLDDPSRTYIECTGSDRPNSAFFTSYIIHRRKIEFVQRHPDWDIYFVLIYHHPHEKIVVIKPDPKKYYGFREWHFKEGLTDVVAFDDDMPEVLPGGYDELMDRLLQKYGDVPAPFNNAPIIQV